MEVINKIIQKVELPIEFVHRYIRHCMDGARAEQKNLKGRSVRMVAFFINNLLDHGHLVTDGIMNEVKPLNNLIL